MTRLSSYLASIFAAACLLAFSCNIALASGTLANTPISNTATLAYDVNGVVQATITSPAATFVVDRKINLAVGEVGGAPSIVGPGQAIAVTTFTVTNTGNDTQDFSLVTANLPNGTIIFNNIPPFSDSFDATGCAAFVESLAAPNGYTPGVDIATFIDELAPDSTKTVYVVCSIPPAQAINTVSVVSLTATALIGGTAGTQGGALTNDALTPNTAGVDTVFANPALTLSADGTIPAQAGGNALATAHDAYRVVSVATNVTKTATCSPAPADCSAAKTGTVITYQLLINITGSGSADALVITDPLPANLTYSGSLVVPPSAVSSDFGVTTPNTLTVNMGSVVAPATLTIQFKATIN
jgi:fimbrial isopeptide formation D2 family protein